MMQALPPVSLAGPGHALRAVLLPVLLLMFFATGVHAAAAPRGLIVALKGAPGHGDTAHEASVQSARVDPAAVQRERLQRVIAATGLGNAAAQHQGPTLRPHGRAAHVLQFDRALSPAEVDNFLARLRASPEVAWAEPNDRESLQSTTPSDPMFGGTGGQWWLQPASGTDGNAIDARLRGV